MIEKGKGVTSGESIFPMYQSKLIKLDEDIAHLQDDLKSFREKLEESDSQVGEEKKTRSSETAKLRNELKAIRESLEAHVKASNDLKKEMAELKQIQKEQAAELQKVRGETRGILVQQQAICERKIIEVVKNPSEESGTKIGKVGMFVITCLVAAGGLAYYFFFRKK